MSGAGLNWKFIFKVLGAILCLESFCLCFTAGVASFYEAWDTPALLTSAGICLLVGCTLFFLGGRQRIQTIGKRESFLTVTLSWLAFSFFGCIPFYISGAIPSFTNAFFETMSGLTTTGATILTDVEAVPKGLLFWRSIIQWLGGIGVVVFSVALLPLLGEGAVQLFDAETSGLTHDKFRPRVTKVAKRLWGIYILLTLTMILLLWVGPMDLYDSVCHTMTTISTGGFSTKQIGVSYWDSIYVESIIILFMILGATNFSLLYFLGKGDFTKMKKDEEFRWFLIIVVFSSLLLTFTLVDGGFAANYGESFRHSAFQVVSAITTTGFATKDYVLWGPFHWMIIILLMIVCGCAGSTTGGLKTVRVVVLVKNTLNEFRRLIHPKAVIPVRLNGRALSREVVERLLAFAFLFVSILFVSWTILTLTGMPIDEALGACVTSISNVGFGFGSNGPSGSFATIPEFSKWYMSFLMLVGRLEIFTVLILVTPGFWKK